MTPSTGHRREGPRLVELTVADGVEAWTAAGFVTEDDRVRIGTVTLRLTGEGEERGVTGWVLSGVAAAGGALDGLPTTVLADAPPVEGDHGPAAPVHPNGVIGLEHVVVSTPDLERSMAALGAAGLDLRRIRGADETGTGLRQAFYRLGPTILEVVSGAVPSGEPAAEAPATFFGLAVDVVDLDATAASLGAGLGTIRPAVQRRRRIATFRHRELGLSVRLAAMDGPPTRPPGPADPSY